MFRETTDTLAGILKSSDGMPCDVRNCSKDVDVLSLIMMLILIQGSVT